MNPRVRNLFDLKRLHAYKRPSPLILVNGLAEQSESWFANRRHLVASLRRQGPRDPRLRRRLAPPPYRRGRRGHGRLPGRPPRKLPRRVRPAPALSSRRLQPRRPDLSDPRGPATAPGLEAGADLPLGGLRRREPADDGRGPPERLRLTGQVGLPPPVALRHRVARRGDRGEVPEPEVEEGRSADPPGDCRPLGRRPPRPGPSSNPVHLGFRRPSHLRRRRLDPGRRADDQGPAGGDPQVRPRPADREVPAGQHPGHPVPPRPPQVDPPGARPGPVPQQGRPADAVQGHPDLGADPRLSTSDLVRFSRKAR